MGSCYHECPIDNSEEYVSIPVTYNSTVWRDALAQLFALVDIEKVTPNCKLVLFYISGSVTSYIEDVFRIRYAGLLPTVGDIRFERITIPNESNAAWPFRIENVVMQSNASNCKYETFQLSTISGYSGYNVHMDNSDATVDYTGELRLYY